VARCSQVSPAANGGAVSVSGASLALRGRPVFDGNFVFGQTAIGGALCVLLAASSTLSLSIADAVFTNNGVDGSTVGE
jgi:hypothetical protein